MDGRTAWSAAGGALVVVAGTNAVAWAAAASSPNSNLPSWPAYAFGAIAVLALYASLAPLLRIWPFGSLRSPPEVIDDCIRAGRDARERIARLGLSDEDAQIEYTRWFIRSSNAIERYVPAVADEFLIAEADSKHFRGQALLVRLIKEKLLVLEQARREI